MATYKKRGDGWQARVRRKTPSGQKTITRTFPRKIQAEQWAADVESQILAGRYQDQRLTQKMGMTELFTWYRGTVLPNRSETNTDGYRLKALESYFGNFGVLEVGPFNCVSFARDRLAAGCTGDTIRRDLGLLSDVFLTAQSFQYIQIQANPVTDAFAIMRKLRTLPAPVHRERRLRDGEETRLLEGANPALREVIAFGLVVPLRESEIQMMQRQHINWGANTLRVWKSKTDWITGKKGRTVPLLPPALEILKRLPARIDGSIWGYKSAHSISQAFTRLCVRVDIEDLHFHDLRHEATSRLFDGHWGRPFQIQEVAVFTGHRDWRSLKRYTHPDPALMAVSA